MRNDSSKASLSVEQSKNALMQASDIDLLTELVRRGLIMRAVLFNPTDRMLLREILPPELGGRSRHFAAHGLGEETVAKGAMRFRQRPRRSEMRERLRGTPVRQKIGDLDEDIVRMSASAARHREYVGHLLDLLSRKQLDNILQQGIERTDATPEMARLGMLMTRTIFDHLVIAMREELDAGLCDIEALWEYLMNDSGYQFASSLVKWDMHMPPNLWASFIYQIIQGAAGSFLDVAEEDLTDRSSD